KGVPAIAASAVAQSPVVPFIQPCWPVSCLRPIERAQCGWVDGGAANTSPRFGRTSMDRRKFLQGALGVPIAGGFAVPALVQAWPPRGITMIVRFPPGGQADLAARPVALALEKILGKSVVVDNRGGAGGLLGNAAAARAEPDGYTLLMSLSSMTFLPEA